MESTDETLQFPGVIHPTLGDSLQNAFSRRDPSNNATHPGLGEVARSLDVDQVTVWLRGTDETLIRVAAWSSTGSINDEPIWTPDEHSFVHRNLSGDTEPVAWGLSNTSGVGAEERISTPIIGLDGVAGVLVIAFTPREEQSDLRRQRVARTASMISNIYRSFERAKSLSERDSLDQATNALADTLIRYRAGDMAEGFRHAVERMATVLAINQVVLYKISESDAHPHLVNSWKRDPTVAEASSNATGADLLEVLGSSVLAQVPAAIDLFTIDTELPSRTGSAVVIPVIVDGTQVGGMLITNPGPGRWADTYPLALSNLALTLHSFVERCQDERALVREREATELVNSLSQRLWTISTLDEASLLGDDLAPLAQFIGADAILLCKTKDGLATPLAEWTTKGFVALGACDGRSTDYCWGAQRCHVGPVTPVELTVSGEPGIFPPCHTGTVLTIGSDGATDATLTVIKAGPLDEDHHLLLARVISALRGFIQRLAMESQVARLRQLESLAATISAEFLSTTAKPVDSSFPQILSAIAAVFDCDEVIWGYRLGIEGRRAGFHYRRRSGVSTPTFGLQARFVTRPLNPDAAVVVDRFTDATLEKYEITKSGADGPQVTGAPIRESDGSVYGLALVDHAPFRLRATAELDSLVHTAQLVHQLHKQHVEATAASHRRRYDDMLIRASGRLLNPTTDSVDDLVMATLEEVGTCFGADRVTYQTDDQSPSELGPYWLSNVGEMRSAETQVRNKQDELRAEFWAFGTAHPDGIMTLSDFSDNARAVWHSMGLESFTAMFATMEIGDQRALLSVAAYGERDWGETERATIRNLGVHLRQAVDAVLARKEMQTNAEMQQLVNQCAAALIEEETLDQALEKTLEIVAEVLGAHSASWIEVDAQSRRLNVIQTHKRHPGFQDLASMRFDEDAWNRAWAAIDAPRFCELKDEPLLSLIAVAPDLKWLPRLVAPVMARSGEIGAVLDVAMRYDPRSDAVLGAVGTIARLVHEVTSRARLNRLLSTTFESAPSGQLLLDGDGVIQAANQALREMLPDATAGRWTDIDTGFTPQGPDREIRVNAGRHDRWIKVKSAQVDTGQLQPITVVHVEDITSERATQAVLQFDATHDELTGLANRRLLEDRMREAPTGVDSSLIMIDVDRFKVVNDSLGHAAGDAVLITLADRLRIAVRTKDLVTRFGGDEFAVFLPGNDDRAELVGLADRLLKTLSQPIDVNGFTVVPTCSLGIASANVDTDSATLLRHADAALGTAKASGRNCHAFFDQKDTEPLRQRLALEMAIRSGVEAGEFLPWFQPEYDLVTGATVGFEALVRWDRPGLGIVPAYEFIDIAEEIGLAPAMSRLALEQSCQLVSRCMALGQSPKIRVNITAAQLQSGTLELEVMSSLARHGIEASDVCLEVTERSLLLDVETTIDTLGRIRSHGIEVAIDDFGTGFSSLEWLKRLPVDTLKIDRTFVSAINQSETDREIVRTIIRLADALGLGVVAEGVEDLAQVVTLLDLGCRRAQGWLWSPAVPADEVLALISRSASRGS